MSDIQAKYSNLDMASPQAFRLPDAMEEIDRQIDRMAAYVGRLDEVLAKVSLATPVSNDLAHVPPPIGESQHTMALYGFANRIRTQNNRLEFMLDTLDL